MAVANAGKTTRTMADPNSAYESMKALWERSRAICGGERFVKDFDTVLDVSEFTNILLPFSPSMTQRQYNFYRAEAELPGIVAQYARILIGGLLRKQPQLKLPDNLPQEATDWIMNSFTQDGSPLSAFLDRSLTEEIETSRAWVYIDYPSVKNKEDMTTEDFRKIRPYPVLWNAESITHWEVGTNPEDGSRHFTLIIIRKYEARKKEGEYHPEMVDTVFVHEIVNGKYQIQKFQKKDPAAKIAVVAGQMQQDYKDISNDDDYELVKIFDQIEANGELLKNIPAWPLNGSVEPVEPMLTPLINREIGLYNKLSRRNHLLYGAATFTPIIKSDMPPEEFEELVGQGLGSWMQIGVDDSAEVLETPTNALKDMDAAISSTMEEMARMGLRMLSPETAQSGVALEIRNAGQTAQLGSLNTKISSQMAKIITFMINWRYDAKLLVSEVEFTLSSDFNPAPLGHEWLRLVTEWYESGYIPRTVWIQILKQNDIVPTDYDDIEGIKEMLSDPVINGDNGKNKDNNSFADDLDEDEK